MQELSRNRSDVTKLKFHCLIRNLLQQSNIKKLLAKVRSKSVDKLFEENLKEPDKLVEVSDDPLWRNMREEKLRLQDNNPLKNNPFYYTERISFELSNLCNYSNIHMKCPLHREEQTKILPLRIIKETIDTLSNYQFAGRVAFHNYNEPLIDPRLFTLVEYTHKKCPDAYIYICTNGFYLDQTIAEELEAFGVSKIHVSIYSKKDLRRLQRINLSIPCELEVMKLDDTLNIYSAPGANSKLKCFAPLNEIIITKDARISLCCFDWANIYTFGSLKEKPINKILCDGLMYDVYSRLSNGERFLNICKNCKGSR